MSSDILLSSVASAPGTLMLLGEYAVLEGSPALVMTLKSKLTVYIKKSKNFSVYSDYFKCWYKEGDSTVPNHVLLIKEIINYFYEYYSITPKEKLEIKIKSAINPNLGFSSSAALNAALLKSMAKLYQLPFNFNELFDIGYKALIKIYKRGSGADLAAALSNYPVALIYPGKYAKSFSLPFFISAIYVGYKTSTPLVLKHVWNSTTKNFRNTIFTEMKHIVNSFITSPSLKLIVEYQNLLKQLGVSCNRIEKALARGKNIASKISGSGLGDCVAIFSKSELTLNELKLLVPTQKKFIYFTSEKLYTNL